MRTSSEQSIHHVLVLGPKESGKTALCQKLSEDNANIVLSKNPQANSAFEKGRSYLHEMSSISSEWRQSVYIPTPVSSVLLVCDFYSHESAEDFAKDFSLYIKRARQVAQEASVTLVITKTDLKCGEYGERRKYVETLWQQQADVGLSHDIEQVTIKEPASFSSLKSRIAKIAPIEAKSVPQQAWGNVPPPKKKLTKKSQSAKDLVDTILTTANAGEPFCIKKSDDLKELLCHYKYKHIQSALDHLSYDESQKVNPKWTPKKVSALRGTTYRHQFFKQTNARLARARVRIAASVLLGFGVLTPVFLLGTVALWEREKRRAPVQAIQAVGREGAPGVFPLRKAKARNGALLPLHVMSRETAKSLQL